LKMKLSTISILNPDPEKVFQDMTAKSISFFCLQRPVYIGSNLIKEMKDISRAEGGCNVRVCLHSEPESKHHDMVVLENKNKYYPPHKHEEKGECFHVIDGKLGILAFDDYGTIIDANLLEKGDIYRIEIGMYHAIIPVSDIVIYHESKPGPFLGGEDSIIPFWAAAEEDTKAVENYTFRALSKLGI